METTSWGIGELHFKGKGTVFSQYRTSLSRSFSTPDFKLYAGSDEANPYVSLEKLLDQEEDYPHTSPSSSSSSLSSSPTSSSPSSSHELVGGNPMFRRPPRAAALKRGAVSLKQSIAVEGNNSMQEDVNAEGSGCGSVEDSDIQTKDMSGRSNIESHNCRLPDGSGSPEAIRPPDSSYMRRQTEEVQVNRQPVGFDARLAAAVASRALGQQEETFGGSDSESESSSSSSSESADF